MLHVMQDADAISRVKTAFQLLTSLKNVACVWLFTSYFLRALSWYLPTTSTFLPWKAVASLKQLLWMISPTNLSAPGNFGTCGCQWWPEQTKTASKTCVYCSVVSVCPSWAGRFVYVIFHWSLLELWLWVTLITLLLNEMWGRRLKLSA